MGMAEPRRKPRLADVMEWDIGNWGRALPFWSEELPPSLEGLTTLALGERNGGLSLYFAARGSRVHCTDVGGPRPQARALHVRYGLADRITYADVDATHIAYADASFDIVALKSMLGALRTWERQARALAEIHRVLKPGGLLFFAENAVGSPMHRWLRRRYVEWWDIWRYLTLDDLPRLTRDFRSASWTTYGFLGVLGRTERQRKVFHWMDRLALPLVPESSRYIIFCRARK